MEKFLEKIAVKLIKKADNTESIIKTWFYFFLLSVLNNIVYAFYIDQKALGKKIWLEIFVFLSLSAVAILLKIDILILPAFAVAVFLFTPNLRNILYLGTAIAVYLSILTIMLVVRISASNRLIIISALFSFLIGYGLVSAGESIASFFRKVKNFFTKITRRFGLAVVVIILVFSSSNAFAFNPSHVTFYTYGGFDAIYNAFHFIALIFSDHSYQGLFFTVMALSLFIAGFRNYVQSLQGRTTGNILSWSMPVLISFALYVALIVPKGQITIYDTVLNKTADVGGIPVGITAVAGIASEVENGIITIIDTTSIDRDTDYENSAGGVGVMTIMNMALHGVRSSDVYLDRSVKRYITDCFFYDLNNPSGTTKYQDLIDSTQSLSTLLGNASHYNSIYTVYYDSSHNSGETMTCHDAWTNISAKINNNANFQTSLKNICASAGIDTTNLTALTHCKDVITSYLGVLYDGQDPTVTGDAMDFIRQDYVAHELYMASVDSDANFLVNYKITNAGMNMGMAFNNWIPTIRAVLISLGLSILPFLIIFLPTPFYGKILGGIAGVFVFMVSWAAIDAIVHHFLVGEAAVLFQSVLIHNVGYGAFETMSVPLQHTMAAWGYVRSLGMGLAVIATGLVTKAGAYGLQMAAGRMETAVASQAGSVGEMATNESEKGNLEKEMISSDAFSRRIAPAFSMQDLIRSDANLQAKRIGQGSAYENITDASATGYNAESMSAGQTNAEAKVAEQNGLTPRQYGGLQGKERAISNTTAWKTAGHGDMDSGAGIIGATQGAVTGGTAAGRNAAVNGNINELASISAKKSAKNLSKDKRQFEAAAQALHLPNNIQTAIKLGEMQGGRIENVVLSKKEAQEVFGANAPGGLYSISMADNGHILQAVAKNGIDMFEVTPNGVKHFDLTNNGQRVWSEQKRGRESVYKNSNVTIVGSTTQVNGDVGEWLKRSHVAGMPKVLANALNGANGSLKFNGKQYTGSVVLNPEQELKMAEGLGELYGDKYKNTIGTLINNAENGRSTTFAFTGKGGSLSQVSVISEDVGENKAYTQSKVGDFEEVDDKYEAALVGGGYGDLYRANMDIFEHSISTKAAVVKIANKLDKFFKAHITSTQGRDITDVVSKSGSSGNDYYEDHSQSNIKSANTSGDMSVSASSGKNPTPFGGAGGSAALKSGWEEQNVTRSIVGHKSDSGNKTGYSNTTTNKLGSGVQLSSDVLKRDFIRDGSKILNRKDLTFAQKVAGITELEENYKAMFTNAIGDHRTLDKFYFDGHHAEQEKSFNAVKTYGGKYNNPYWKKQMDTENEYDTFINGGIYSSNANMSNNADKSRDDGINPPSGFSRR